MKNFLSREEEGGRCSPRSTEAPPVRAGKKGERPRRVPPRGHGRQAVERGSPNRATRRLQKSTRALEGDSLGSASARGVLTPPASASACEHRRLRKYGNVFGDSWVRWGDVGVCTAPAVSPAQIITLRTITGGCSMSAGYCAAVLGSGGYSESTGSNGCALDASPSEFRAGPTRR